MLLKVIIMKVILKNDCKPHTQLYFYNIMPKNFYDKAMIFTVSNDISLSICWHGETT